MVSSRFRLVAEPLEAARDKPKIISKLASLMCSGYKKELISDQGKLCGGAVRAGCAIQTIEKLFDEAASDAGFDQRGDLVPTLELVEDLVNVWRKALTA